MHYIIYKTINKLDGRYYIGSHKTEELDDGYLGSGVRLKRAIEKYGAENFEREVLHVFDSPDEMFDKEAELVTEDEVKNPDCYNLKKGGFGGWDHIDYNSLSRSRIEGNRKGGSISIIRTKRKRSPEVSRLVAIRGREEGWFGYIGGMNGHSHTIETKRNMSESHTGSKNSQFGTRWITNGTESKKIKKDQEIPEGYRPGRVIK